MYLHDVCTQDNVHIRSTIPTIVKYAKSIQILVQIRTPPPATMQFTSCLGVFFASLYVFFLLVFSPLLMLLSLNSKRILVLESKVLTNKLPKGVSKQHYLTPRTKCSIN